MMSNSQIVFPEGSNETQNKIKKKKKDSVFGLEPGYSLLPMKISF